MVWGLKELNIRFGRLGLDAKVLHGFYSSVGEELAPLSHSRKLDGG